jgi:hypothetical protein
LNAGFSFFARIRFMLRRGEEKRTLSHDCCQLPSTTRR